MYTTYYDINGQCHKWLTNNKISDDNTLLFNDELKSLHINLLEMLEFWIEFAKDNNIKYFAICGTLLGAIRNNGIIPFDDDIDLGILLIDYFKIKRQIDKIFKNKFYITRADVGFRIFMADKSSGFIDIWVFDKYKNRIIYACPFKNDTPTYYASVYLDREYFYTNDITNIKYKMFEHLSIPVPSNSKRYLKRAYGQKCLTEYVSSTDIHSIYEILPMYEITQALFTICDKLNLDNDVDIKKHGSSIIIQILFLFGRDMNRDKKYILNRLITILKL